MVSHQVTASGMPIATVLQTVHLIPDSDPRWTFFGVRFRDCLIPAATRLCSEKKTLIFWKRLCSNCFTPMVYWGTC